MNTITTETDNEKQIELYEHEIYYYCDEYIATLEDPSFIYDVNTFNSMLRHIYKRLFKLKKKDTKYNNKKSNLDYSNIELLDSIFDIYIDLCGRYKQTPYMLGYCNLTGIDKDTINSWVRGEYRTASPAHSATAKNWKHTLESYIESGAGAGGIGKIFLAKAVYGYTETAPIQLQQANTSELLTADEIENEYLLEDTATKEV